MIEIQELRKDFAHDEIIKELSLDIHPGETLGIWGAPRSGLTTFMRLIAGFLTPTTGRVLIDERDASIDRAYISQVLSYVPEKLTLPAAMRVSDIIRFAANMRHMKKASHIADQLREKLELEDCWNLRLGHLPNSMQRLVSMAQALVHQPRILLLDDPLHDRDSWQKQRLYSWLADAEPFAIRVVSSHSLEDLIPLCQSVLFFQRGRLIRTLQTDQLKTAKQLQAALKFETEVSST